MTAAALSAAFVVTAHSVHTQPSTPFTALSLVPVGGPEPHTLAGVRPQTSTNRQVRIEVSNQERTAMTYQTVVTGPGAFRWVGRCALPAGHSWSRTLEVPGTGPVRVDLFRNGGTDVAPYRTVTLAGAAP